MSTHYQVVIVGGGTGGIMTAAQLRRKNKKLSIALIEPNTVHYYQPAWTLVGAGAFRFEATKKAEKKLIPPGVDWIQDKVTSFEPESNTVNLASGGQLHYQVMVISAGIQMDIDAMPGLREDVSCIAAVQRWQCHFYTACHPDPLWRGPTEDHVSG
jgi:sulfide:quinone oxidoreductase